MRKSHEEDTYAHDEEDDMRRGRLLRLLLERDAPPWLDSVADDDDDEDEEEDSVLWPLGASDEPRSLVSLFLP